MQNIQQTRVCKKCGQEKPIEQFPRHSESGRRWSCQSCERARVNAWVEDNHAQHLAKCRARYQKDPSKRWTEERKQRARQSGREQNARLRAQVYAAYGGQCVCCGERNEKFLSLDHVNNDGKRHRSELGFTGGASLYRWAIRNGYPKTLQLLCFNCNMGKARNGGVCPHQEGATTIP